MPLHPAPSKSSSQPLRPVEGLLHDGGNDVWNPRHYSTAKGLRMRHAGGGERPRSHPLAHQWRGQILLRSQRSTPGDRCHLGAGLSGSLSTGQATKSRRQGLLPTSCPGLAMRRQTTVDQALIRGLRASTVVRPGASARRSIGRRRLSWLPARFDRSCPPIRAMPQHPFALATQTSGRCSASDLVRYDFIATRCRLGLHRIDAAHPLANSEIDCLA
jgi:hypothetical protein